MLKAVLCFTCTKLSLRQGIHTTSACMAGGRWRERHGESCNANEYGPLVDVPDWSYLDGTPAPLSKGEIKRREHYRNLGKRALRAMEELQIAKELHKKKQQAVKEQDEQVQPRFKPRVKR